MTMKKWQCVYLKKGENNHNPRGGLLTTFNHPGPDTVTSYQAYFNFSMANIISMGMANIPWKIVCLNRKTV